MSAKARVTRQNGPVLNGDTEEARNPKKRTTAKASTSSGQTEGTETKRKPLMSAAQEMLEEAEGKGAQTAFFFKTTFKRYQVQLSILTDLEAEIQTMGVTVKKEYVKGRQNVYTNPAISEYNKTATAANQTVTTLMNIIRNAPPAKEGETTLADAMRELMSGA